MRLTQSAVSVLVRQLAAQFGVRLFDRITRAGRSMSPAAERFIAVARRLLEHG